jgi:RNA polymerase sigma factor (sigma-70 family)
MDGASDGELIAQSGRTSGAFALIFERHFEAVYRYTLLRLGREVAEEITAQVFAEAFNGRAKFDPRRPSARPWLLGIATNLIRRRRRSERRQLAAHRRWIGTLVSEDPSEDVANRVDAEALAPALALALHELRPEDRDALLLYVWADLSYEEIGQALGIPIGTVASRISRARRSIRARITTPVASLERWGPPPSLGEWSKRRN